MKLDETRPIFRVFFLISGMCIPCYCLAELRFAGSSILSDFSLRTFRRRTHGITATLQQIRSPKDVDSGVRSARAPPVQLPFLVSLARPRSLISRVSRAPRVSHPRSLPPLSHLGSIAATPSALARVPTPPPASLISLFPLKTYLVPCFAE